MQETLNSSTSLKLLAAPPSVAIEDFLHRNQQWIESSIGCSLGDAITFDFHLPFAHLALSDLFTNIPLDTRSVSYTSALRPVVAKWETPPGASPHLGLSISRNRDDGVAAGNFGWEPIWGYTPLAIWLNGCAQAIIHSSVPYVPYNDSGRESPRSLLIVNKCEIRQVLRILQAIEVPRRISMIAGRDIELPSDSYNWDSVILNPELERFVRQDFESFFEREEWFQRHHLPFRRGYLFYGPPGNGKTSVARLMASRPSVRAFGIDFRADRDAPYSAEQLSNLFDVAAAQAPSLVILEDIDKIGGGDPEFMSHAINVMLSCMDGLTTQDGIVVVATANDPSCLGNSLLRRPGRFDRLVHFSSPTADLRRRYLQYLSGGTLDLPETSKTAKALDRFSFARVREAYILAGQFAFERGDDVNSDDIALAARQIRREGRQLNRGDGSVGFATGERETESTYEPAEVA